GVSDTRPELPAALDPVVAKALAKDAKARYRSAGEFAAALRQVTGLETKEVQRLKRSKLIPVLVASALAVALAVGVWLAIRPSQAPPGGSPAVKPYRLASIDATTLKVTRAYPGGPLFPYSLQAAPKSLAVG